MERLNINEELYMYSCAMQSYMEALSSLLKVSSNTKNTVCLEVILEAGNQLVQLPKYIYTEIRSTSDQTDRLT